MTRITASLILAAITTSIAAPAAHAEIIYGLANSGTTLFTFDSTLSTKIISGHAISGLTANDHINAIDVRPATGALYAIGTFGTVYSINPINGAATFLGNAGTFDGTHFGSDFNPVLDNLSLSSDTGSNLRITPGGALLANDAALAYAPADVHAGAPANIVGLAYSNNVPNAVTTTLYGIDSNFDTLVSLSNPTSGLITTIGSLGVDSSDIVGFDISSTGVAYVSLEPVNSSISKLYTINLATGAATLIGQIGGGFAVDDIALVGGGGASAPEPASLLLIGLTGPLLLLRRKTAIRS